MSLVVEGLVKIDHEQQAWALVFSWRRHGLPLTRHRTLNAGVLQELQVRLTAYTTAKINL